MPMIRAIASLLLLLACAAPSALANENGPVKTRPKVTKWLINFDGARLAARKEHKVILAFFSGSDFEPYTQKLMREVLNTDAFGEWAADNVILFQADFPKERRLPATIAAQNNQLRQKFSIVVVPTFILMDNSGLPFARAGYDELRLRDDEAAGQPTACLKYLDETLKNRPPDEELIRQKSAIDCIAFGKKHFLSSVFLISQGHLDKSDEIRDELEKNQQFVRYVNHNVAFADVQWPDDGDDSATAKVLRDFLIVQKIAPTPLQLVAYDMQTNQVKGRMVSVDPGKVDGIISFIQANLPRIDYTSGWIDDYRLAQAIAEQQGRYILIAFTSMDSSEFSKKMDEEIFQTDEFKQYAVKKLVTVRIDFPTKTAQPTALASQNKILAEMFALKGYPTVVVLTPQGKRIGESKYMKGGPEGFLKNLSAAIKIEDDRRALLYGDGSK